MTLDIRANVICDLGPVISGGFSDDHIQGTGLIRTRGEVILQGLHTCRPGDVVRFAYERNGILTRVPRALHVLSSFADPFRRQTTVSIGCKLTMLENLRENKTTNPAEDEANEGIPCSEYGKVPINITFNFIASQCIAALGLSLYAPLNLTGSVAIGTFDFSSGYTSILSDILFSQCKVGYLDADEKLRIVDLNFLPPTGPVYDENDIIDVTPIRSGDIPADIVIVDYSYNRFKQPDAEDFTGDNFLKRNWERDETIGEPQFVYITNRDGDLVYVASYSPRSVTETKYDRFDRAIQRIETSTTHAAAVNSAYFADLLENGETPLYTGGQSATSQTVTDFIYKYNESELWSPPDNAASCSYWYSSSGKLFDANEDNQQLGQVQTSYSTGLEIAGSMNLPEYVFVDGSVLHPGTDLYLTETHAVSYETDEESGITKTITTHDQANMFTQPGQQGLALMAEELENSNAALALMFWGIEQTRVGVQVATHYDRNYGLQKRPSAAERTKTAYYKDPRASESRNVFIQGAEGVGITTTYSMPWAPDDEIAVITVGSSTQYVVTPSQAEVMATAFGRVQQKLTYGHRMGFASQLIPSKLPAYAAETVNLHLGGIIGNYLVNGQSWSFDSNGIVANVDLLYLGGVGSTTEEYRVPAPWAPVQDGITQMPIAPSITTNNSPAPANSITTPGNFDPTNFSSTIWDELPVNTPPTYEKEITTEVLVPPYREEQLYDFPTKVALTVTRTAVSLPITTDVPVVTRVSASVIQSFTRSDVTLPLRTTLSITAIPQVQWVQSNALPLLGSAITSSAPSGWTQIYNAHNDDTPVASGTFPFSFPFNGAAYTSCFISPNGYVTFGSGSSVYNSFSATNPALPKIFLNAMDDSVQRIYTRSTANAFRIRYEGNISSAGTGTSYRTFELAFFSSDVNYGYPVFEVRFGHSPDNNGFFSPYSASARLTAFDLAPAADTSWVFFGNDQEGTDWTGVDNSYLIPVE